MCTYVLYKGQVYKVRFVSKVFDCLKCSSRRIIQITHALFGCLQNKAHIQQTTWALALAKRCIVSIVRYILETVCEFDLETSYITISTPSTSKLNITFYMY